MATEPRLLGSHGYIAVYSTCKLRNRKKRSEKSNKGAKKKSSWRIRFGGQREGKHQEAIYYVPGYRGCGRASGYLRVIATVALCFLPLAALVVGLSWSPGSEVRVGRTAVIPLVMHLLRMRV